VVVQASQRLHTPPWTKTIQVNVKPCEHNTRAVHRGYNRYSCNHRSPFMQLLTAPFMASPPPHVTMVQVNVKSHNTRVVRQDPASASPASPIKATTAHQALQTREPAPDHAKERQWFSGGCFS